MNNHPTPTRIKTVLAVFKKFCYRYVGTATGPVLVLRYILRKPVVVHMNRYEVYSIITLHGQKSIVQK